MELDKNDPKSVSATHPTTQTNQPLMTALFRAQRDAENAIQALEKRGYQKEDISVMMSDETRRRFAAESKSSPTVGAKMAEGATFGSVVGGAAGAILAGILVVAAPIVIPGLGLLVAGPLVAALAGAGAGGLAGGLLGSLVAVGIPEAHAKVYELGIREGGVLITVQPRTAEDTVAIEADWTRCHAERARV
ncbi:MAG: hypothetical protein JNK05_25195 [Myxococcales bacterium]|nr:hypothetical protein [Myxococcales bacterium]